MSNVKSFLSKNLKGDPVIWTIFLLLCVLSVIEMYSASSTLAYKQASNHSIPILKHIVFLGVGAFIVFVFHKLPNRLIQIFSYVALMVSIILLIFVMTKGIEANEAKRWLQIGPLKFQPSELAKLSLIIVVADLISRLKNRPEKSKIYFYIIIAVALIVIGLVLLENFSTAAIMGITVFSMMYIGAVPYKRLLAILATTLVALVLLFVIVKNVPKEKMPKLFDRAYTWVSRAESKSESRYEINDYNLQVQHGRIAIANGGLFGVFPGNSIERDYLPHAYDDFIFAIVIEEMGLIGGLFIIFLYLWLLFRTGMIANLCKNRFPAILVIGLGLIITLQAAINIFVGSGFGVVTGQPLPLISRGGTSIIVTCIYFGIIQGVYTMAKEDNKKIETAEEIDISEIKE